MKTKLDFYLSLLFKPLFFVWLFSLVLFLAFGDQARIIRQSFTVLSVVYAAFIVYAVYSLIMAVREALKDEDE